MRIWNDAKELEQCPREESYTELFQLMGDKPGQDAIRADSPNKSHCRWLARDPNACMALPAGIEGLEDKVGHVCPHNVYILQHQVFENRDSVADALERIFRLVNAAEVGLLSESDLDPLSITELLTAKVELDRQQSDRMQREHERASMEARSNQGGRGIDFDDPNR